MFWGVDTIFGLPGDGINGIFEGLRTHRDKLHFIKVRHEETAAFAACAYAKYTGRLGVCLATSDPGGIHLLNGFYDAKCDGQSVLAITGLTFHDLIGTHYQQDVDLDKLFMDVSVYNQRLMGPANLDNVLDEAIKTALPRKVVEHITIPRDIGDMPASEGHRSKANPKHHSGVSTRTRQAKCIQIDTDPARIVRYLADVGITAGCKTTFTYLRNYHYLDRTLFEDARRYEVLTLRFAGEHGKWSAYSIAAAVAFREGLAKGDSKHAYQIILTVLKDKAREIL